MTEYQDAFISYGRVDSKALAAKLYDRLSQEGLKVWFDFADIPLGVDYQKQIDDGIEATHNFLFIISPHSVHSPYCRLEIDLALQYNKRIIPLLHVEKIEQETWQARNPNGSESEWQNFVAEGKHSAFTKMYPVISKINWIFFREDQDDFETSIQGLLSVIHRHESYVQDHTIYLKAALDWDRHQQSSDYLLTGEALQQALQWLKTSFPGEQSPCVPSDLHCRFISQSHLADRNQHSDIYLCFADEDQSLAMVLYWRLLHEGWLAWNRKLDLDPSSSLQDKNFRAIEAADNFIYFFSNHSQKSRGCQKELAHAFNLEKRIIPIQVNRGDTQKTDLEKLSFKTTTDSGRALNRIYSRLESKEENSILEQLKSLNFIKLFNAQSSTISAIGFKQLSQKLAEDASFHYQQTDLLMRSLLWKGHRYNPQLLLQGDRLAQAQSWLQLAQDLKKGFYTVLQEDYIRVSASTAPPPEVEVFLLYAAVDEGFTARINQALQLQGRSIWFAGDQLDPENPEAFEYRQKMLFEASNCIAIVSPSLLSDPTAQLLLRDVISLQKRLIPVVYRRIDPSRLAALPDHLRQDVQPILSLFGQMDNFDWIDFAHHNREFHTAIGDLIRLLDLDRDYVQAHSKWGLRARQWLQAGQTEALLLQNHELTAAEAWLYRAVHEHRSPLVTEAQRSFIETSRQTQDQHLQQAEQQRQRELNRARRLAIASTAAGVLMTGMALFSSIQLRKAELETVETLRISAALLFSEGKELQALAQATHAYQRLRTSLLDVFIEKENLPLKVQGTLQNFLLNIHESNELAAQVIQLSPSGQWLVIHQQDGTLQVWKPNGAKQLEWETSRQAVGFLAISANDRLLATGGTGGEVSLWNLETGDLLHTWSAHSEPLTSLTFSPDRQSLLTSGGGKVYRWNLAGQDQAHFDHPEPIVQAVFSPSGRRVLTLNQNQQAQLWTAEGKSLGVLNSPSPICSFAFSPQGDFLLTGHEDGELLLWAVEGQESFESTRLAPPGLDPLKRQTISNQPIHSIAISPQFEGLADPPQVTDSEPTDSQATGSEPTDSQAIDSQVIDSEPIDSQATDSEPIDSQATDSEPTDSEPIDSQPTDSEPTDFQAIDSEPIDSQATDSEPIDFQAIDSEPIDSQATDSQAIDSQVIDSEPTDSQATDSEPTDFQAIDSEPIDFQATDSEPTDIVVATGSAGGVIRLWDRSLQLRRQIFAHTGAIQSIHFSQAEGTLGNSNLSKTGDPGGIISLGQQDRILRFWSLEGWQKFAFDLGNSSIKTLLISPDRTFLVTLTQGGQARSWSLQDHQRYTLYSTGEQINTVRYSPDGQFLVTLSAEGILELWFVNLEQGTPQKLRQWSRVQEVTFSADSQQLLWLAEDPAQGQVIQIRSLLPGQLDYGRTLLTPESRSHRLFNLQVSPPGDRIAVQSRSGQAFIWNLQGEQFLSFHPHENPLQILTFHPLNNSFVTTDALGEMKYWQEDGQLLWTKDFSNEEGSGGIYLTQFSPNGKWLITVQWTGVSQVWRIPEGEPYQTLNDNLSDNPINGKVLSIAFANPAKQAFNPVFLVKRSDSSLFFQFWRDQGQDMETTELSFNEDGTKEADFVPNSSPNSPPIKVPWVKTISWGGIARIWDIEGNKLVEIQNNHDGEVQSITVSPDRRWFVTAGWDGTAKIWPIVSSTELIAASCQWLAPYLSTFPKDDPRQEVCAPQP